MKIYVVHGVDQDGYTTSKHAEIHYAGQSESEALEAIERARKEEGRRFAWELVLEVWENGKRISEEYL